MMKMQHWGLLFLGLAYCSTIYSQETAKDSIRSFSLGEVIVMEQLPVSPDREISSLKIRQMDIEKVPEALEWMPGITLTEASSRGETMIYLGFTE